MSPLPLPPAWTGFCAHLRDRCTRLGVDWVEEPGPTVAYANGSGLQVSGYFVDSPRPILAVATGKPLEQWLGILVHEACHMDQWHEQAPCWVGNKMPDGREAGDWLDDWIEGRLELSAADLAGVVERIKAVELDCERRALEAIARHRLPLDRAEYARRANAYVHFYDHVAATRQWNPPGLAPYQVEAVWRLAPDRLVAVAPPSLKAAYARHYPSRPPHRAVPGPATPARSGGSRDFRP